MSVMDLEVNRGARMGGGGGIEEVNSNGKVNMGEGLNRGNRDE